MKEKFFSKQIKIFGDSRLSEIYKPENFGVNMNFERFLIYLKHNLKWHWINSHTNQIKLSVYVVILILLYQKYWI